MEKYHIIDFASDVQNGTVNEKDLLSVGFSKKDGYFIYAKRKNKTEAFIVLEQDGAGNIYANALAVKKFLASYHILNIGILLVYDTINKYSGDLLHKSDVLFLHFNSTSQPNTVPYNNVFTGSYKYKISPYPKISSEKLFELQKIARLCSLECDIADGELVGTEYFAFLSDLERKMLDFAAKTAEFDKDNSTMSRIKAEKLTLSVVNSEYYTDLFSGMDRKSGTVVYDGIGGAVLSDCEGIFMDVNVNTEKNIESLYECIKTFAEDING